MRAAVLGSVKQWAPGGAVPREPFALDPACRDETTMFEVDLLLGVKQVSALRARWQTEKPWTHASACRACASCGDVLNVWTRASTGR